MSGLAQDDFLLFEDGVPQIITHFNQGRVPLSLGIALDISESMYGQRIEDARFALNRFLLDLLDPSDEVFLVAFNHEPRLEASWTSDPRRLINRLDDVRPFGATAIYDAMLASLPMLESRSHQRAAILLISDGSDTASDNDVREVKTLLRRGDAFVYAIAIDAGKARPIHDRINPYALREMTDGSGGYTEVVHDSLELSPATARIADELNHQYTLSYSPTHPARREVPQHSRPGSETGSLRAGAPRIHREAARLRRVRWVSAGLVPVGVTSAREERRRVLR